MRAFVEHQVIRGLGQKSMIILPINNGSLIISVPYNQDNIYFGHLFAEDEWSSSAPKPEDGFKEIILPDFLAEQLYANYTNRNRIDCETSGHLKELVMAHKNAPPKANIVASVQQTLEQIRSCDL